MRLDQVGYLPDDSKRAYLMTAPTGRIRFKVENARGRTVLTGTPGRRTGSWNAAFPSVRVLDLTRLTDRGTYRVAVSGPGVRAHSPWFRVGPAAEVLGPLLPRLLRFFQAQRDGPDVVPSVLGRRPSHLADRAATVYRPPRHRNGELVGGLVPVPGAATVDVSGGWADAGDFLKFTTTASYSTAVLYYAYRAVPSEPALAAEADHGLKWLDKMWDERTGTLYAQVGIGIGGAGYLSDHDVWRLPESDDMRRVGRGDPGYLLRYRPVFRAAAPGARISPNLAGRVAAAFALAAQIRARDDPGAARRALERAASIYARADTAPGGGLVTTFPHGFYPETSWADDLEFGTVELARAARALGDRRADGWLRQAAHWAATVLRSDEQGPLGISDVSVLAHTDLIEALDQSASNLGIGRDELVAALKQRLDAATAKAARDPFGAAADPTVSDSAATSFGLASTALLYRRVSGDTSYDAFGTGQRGWALGANAWGSSFVIGAGTTYPRCPQHQVANLTEGAVLEGAVVNGPNAAAGFRNPDVLDDMRPCTVPGFAQYDGHGSRYTDQIGAWQSIEPADDYTAAAILTTALATTPAPPTGRHRRR
ncbi:glycoside hydrolase family 9 protein [Actinomadura madurae]|uniref:glycoside hydrolase family 9 protein n=1 Tax=Actinomadura madurae TaxID=1993 RepID=UPI0020D25475|nr:glycoside hydrolase family 9 protein [Actinomadura madurae]MCQ0011054.1 glycoside hydrolase family 9 protein [Actinomadura madurae]